MRAQFHWKGKFSLAAKEPLDSRKWKISTASSHTHADTTQHGQEYLGSVPYPAIEWLSKLNQLNGPKPQFPHPENGHDNTCLLNLSEIVK